MYYELIIIWATGEENRYLYEDKETAEERGAFFKIAFGEQVNYYWVRTV